MRIDVGIGRVTRKIQPEHVELLTPALVLPYQYYKAAAVPPTVLDVGSVVFIQGTDHLEGDPPRSPATMDKSEIFVHWVGSDGREDYGWLSSFTQYRAVKKQVRCILGTSEQLGAWDVIRRRAWKNDITALDWIEKYGAKYLPLLNGAIREFGGKSPKSDDADSISRRLARLIRENTMARKNKQEIEEVEEEVMEDEELEDEELEEDEGDEEVEADEEDEEEEAPAPKKGAKKGAKKAAKEKAPRAPAGQSVGSTLVKLLKGDSKKYAQMLADGKNLKKAQLEKLRDGINEEAAAAREADKGSLASQLSSANRLVRRLARAAE